MKWVTRERVKVDRVACPWLIKHFIDPDAEFLFVPSDQVTDVARRTGAIPYDVEGAELGHVEGRCSFESLILKYGLTDPALDYLAKIVHGADTKDTDIVPEAAGLKAVALGFSLLYPDDDHRILAEEFRVYDALYAWCRQQVGAA
ncbi:MAG: chromate resistance protein [Armatimonadota bacterium]|nr:chromate resistance protein [Armatimonadota bacterium]MDR7550593.1 chromate resistance protein [Armatimonadota bacterium]